MLTDAESGDTELVEGIVPGLGGHRAGLTLSPPRGRVLSDPSRMATRARRHRDPELSWIVSETRSRARLTETNALGDHGLLSANDLADPFRPRA